MVALVSVKSLLQDPLDKLASTTTRVNDAHVANMVLYPQHVWGEL